MRAVRTISVAALVLLLTPLLCVCVVVGCVVAVVRR